MALAISVVATLVVMVTMMTTTTLGLKCQKTGLCTCKTDNGTIDLSPLAVNGSARFHDVAGPEKPYVYSWNPCLPFNEGGSCYDVAVCEKNNDTNDAYNLGYATSAQFITWPDTGQLSIQYMRGGGDGIIIVSSIDLVCNPKEEAKLDVYGKTSVGFFAYIILSWSEVKVLLENYSASDTQTDRVTQVYQGEGDRMAVSCGAVTDFEGTGII